MPPRLLPSRHTARATARSLADDLRQRTDEDLVALLQARPDLARPMPADLTALAARASNRASVHRAVERLDRGLWRTLQACVVAAQATAPSGEPVGPVDDAAVTALLGVDAGSVAPRLEQLRRLALLWHSARGAELVRAVPEVFGPHPAGLGLRGADVDPRYAAHTPPLGPQLRELLDSAPDGALSVLDRLTSCGPTGRLPAAGPTRAAAQWLVDVGLAVPSGVGHITLIREVALDRRGGRLYPDPVDPVDPSGPGGATDPAGLDPPPIAGVQLAAEPVERLAGSAARELLDQLDQLACWLPEAAPRVLRSGGLSVRDLARLATALDGSPERARFVVELSYAARLLADDGEVVPVWALTPDADAWQTREAGARLAALARAWLDSPRAGHRVSSGALGPDGHWPGVRALRADLLHVWSEHGRADLSGAGRLDADSSRRGLTPAELTALLCWRRPMRDPALTAAAVEALAQEAEWLGLVALGALSILGQALATGADDAELAQLAADRLPPAVDHVVLQGDLTAIAPGPLDSALGRFMRLVSDVESRGGALVLRFTAESVRRALDAGHTADDLLAELSRVSRTPVPQPLDYLVRDVARRHGQARVGGATAYLRCDDEAQLAAMLADRALGPALLRRIAPTVLVSRAEPALLVELLREAGHAPVHEGVDGSVVVAERPARRARRVRDPSAGNPPLGPIDLATGRAVVAALRSAPPRPQPGQAAARVLDGDPAEVTSLLRVAASDGLAVWLGYADGNGRTARHLVRPLRVDGGRLYAVSADADAELVFLLHRITGAAPA